MYSTQLKKTIKTYYMVSSFDVGSSMMGLIGVIIGIFWGFNLKKKFTAGGLFNLKAGTKPNREGSVLKTGFFARMRKMRELNKMSNKQKAGLLGHLGINLKEIANLNTKTDGNGGREIKRVL